MSSQHFKINLRKGWLLCHNTFILNSETNISAEILHEIQLVELSPILFSSPEPKAQVSYCHSVASGVRRPASGVRRRRRRRRRKLFTFSTSSSERLKGF